MKFKDRAFPYPVLESFNRDVEDSAFQVNLQPPTFDKNFIYIEAEFHLSNTSLLQMIANGDAIFNVHIDCNSTFFRKRFSSTESKIKVEIPVNDIKNRVELNFFICSLVNSEEYKIEGSHADYGDNKFIIQKGDILAYAETQSFLIADKDSLKKISSIMVINDGGDIKMMDVDYEDNKISVDLPTEDYQRYAVLQKNHDVKATMLFSIVMPVLVEAISILKEKEENDLIYRWEIILNQRVDEVIKNNLCLEGNTVKIANFILEGVYKRSLHEIYELIEGDQN